MGSRRNKTTWVDKTKHMKEVGSDTLVEALRPQRTTTSRSMAGDVRTKSRETLKDYLGRSTKWIILFSATCTLIAAVLLWWDPVRYSARVVMLARDGNDKGVVKDLLARDAPSDQSRLYHLATSTAMFEHLIERFDLYTHYGIDTLQPYASERAMNNLMHSVTASEPDGTCLVVTAKDRDRKMASDLANEVYAELRRMAEAMSRAHIARTVELYAQVIKATEVDLENQVKRLSALVAGPDGLPHGQRKAVGEHAEPSSAEFQLAQIVAEVAAENQDLVEAQRVQAITLALADTEHTPEVLLIRRAQEDVSISPPLRVATRLIIVALLSLLGALLVAAVWFLHRKEFKEFLLSTDDPRDA